MSCHMVDAVRVLAMALALAWIGPGIAVAGGKGDPVPGGTAHARDARGHAGEEAEAKAKARAAKASRAGHGGTGKPLIRPGAGGGLDPSVLLKGRGHLPLQGLKDVRQGFRAPAARAGIPARRAGARRPDGRERRPVMPGAEVSTSKGMVFGGGDGRAHGRGAARYRPGGFAGRDWTASGRKGWRYGRARRPSYDSRRDEFVFPDGRRVRGRDPKGRPGRVSKDGSIVYRDGTVVRHDVRTGETTVERPDGTVSQRPYTRGPRNERPKYDPATDSYVYSDGKRVRARDPQGRRGIVREDGSIEYEDGTVVTHDTKTGDTVINRPDGTTVVDRRGTRRSAPPRYDPDQDAYVYEDGSGPGTRIRATDPSGNRGVVQPDGSIRYSDGTVVRRDSTRGVTEVIKPDGSRTMYYSDGTVYSYNASSGRRSLRRPGAQKEEVLEGGRKDATDGGADGGDEGEGSGGSDGGSDDEGAGEQDGRDGGAEQEADGGDESASGDDEGGGTGRDDDGDGASSRPGGDGRARGDRSPKRVVDDFVRRKRGEIGPAGRTDCAGRPGGFVGPAARPMEPGTDTPCTEELVEQAGAETDDGPEAPDPVDHAWTDEAARQAPAPGPGPDCDERIMDCDDAGPSGYLRDPLDLSPVINPAP